MSNYDFKNPAAVDWKVYDYAQSPPWRSHPAVQIPLSSENGGWSEGVTGREGSLEAAPAHTHRKYPNCRKENKVFCCMKGGKKCDFIIINPKLPWDHSPLSPGLEEQTQRTAGPDWLLWSTHTQTQIQQWQTKRKPSLKKLHRHSIRKE